ncbi:monovalent cation/H+ antiporter subunit D [Ectothiorhodospiraceae bacterium 2226]|nr:monovalent cation/H+ antiporter subunit D [Ectothiorhodospiraceae bacterium 2226]
MNHWIIAPFLLPLMAGVLMLLVARAGLAWQRAVGFASAVALLAVSVLLLIQAADGSYGVYVLGNWPPPFGIVLVLDRLSALMVLLTAVVAVFTLWYALRGTDALGRNFHPLFQLQLAGLNGAFLTGDLFNLFVFFEILLIASYGLLLHGGGASRTRAGLHYVVLNLAGSALFLIAVGILYGLTGTLNMADLAVRVAQAPAEQAGLLRTGALLLFVVFALKAALLPLYFWLPAAYSNTTAPVAALFAIMTKVGVYAIVRVYTLIFGEGAGGAANVLTDWLLPLGLATLMLGMIGALAARGLRRLVAYMVVVSVGMLLTAAGLFTTLSMAAALVYLVHTTLVTAAMFLLVDVIARQRGDDRLAPLPELRQPLLLGGLFFIGAVALVGMPPLSGFLGKFMILHAARGEAQVGWVWAVVLLSSLLGLVALSRAGSVVFWKTRGSVEAPRAGWGALLPVIALLAASPLLVVFGGPVTAYAQATAAQLSAPGHYVHSVLRTDAVVGDVPREVTP